MFSDQSLYYKCKDCEIFLDLGCAILNNIKTSWYAEEKLHYSHAHFLRRCKPGPDARGSCLMCELPLTPSAVSYGCSQCYLFAHERCLDLPREIQHPVLQAHSLTRLDFTHTCGGGKVCDACGLHVEGAPLSCLECSFYLHLRCADSLLRGLMHKSHHHKLFYLANNAKLRFKNGCRVCMRDDDGPMGTICIIAWSVVGGLISSVLRYPSPLSRNLITFIHLFVKYSYPKTTLWSIVTFVRQWYTQDIMPIAAKNVVF